jgi:hypothetical protein
LTRIDRHRQVLLPRLKHDVTSDGIKVRKRLLYEKTEQGTLVFNLGEFALTANQPTADDFRQEEQRD